MRSWCRKYYFLIVLATLSGCLPDKTQEEMKKWNVTLDRESKRPYGTYLAYESLKYYFPDAVVEALPHGFKYSDMDNRMKYNTTGRNLLILEGFDFYVSAEEWKELKNIATAGNEVVIFCSRLDNNIEKELGCHKERRSEEDQIIYSFLSASENKDVLSIANDTGRRFGYRGRSLRGYFSFANDSAGHSDNLTAEAEEPDDTSSVMPVYEILGKVGDVPNLVKFAIGQGHVTIHAAPLVLSNYFLLQDGNVAYLTDIWNTLPDHINRVYWHDYYRRDASMSNFSVLWRFPATRWALLLGIFALGVYVLFESKRKQRIIPMIPPLKNESVSFVETVGRLYYNKGDHANLAEKMVQQFLEWVRMRYFLNTNLLNENFIYQLTIKSWQPEAKVRGLLDMIHEVNTRTANTDDAYLYQLYNTIQQFYKNDNK